MWNIKRREEKKIHKNSEHLLPYKQIFKYVNAKCAKYTTRLKMSTISCRPSILLYASSSYPVLSRRWTKKQKQKSWKNTQHAHEVANHGLLMHYDNFYNLVSHWSSIVITYTYIIPTIWPLLKRIENKTNENKCT